MENMVELILNPVRMRVLMALAGRQMTAQQLAEVLGDVPVATLYRHINRLTEAGVLTVASERKVRGTVEKAYTLTAQGPQLSLEEFTSLSQSEHLRYFIMFTASLMDDYSRYIQHSDPHRMVEDGVGYRKLPLELSDEEFVKFATGLNDAILPYVTNQPAKNRRRRLFSYALMPAIEAQEELKSQE